MAYTYKYRLLSAPTTLDDGSSVIIHAIQVIYRIDAGSWLVLPRHDKNLNVPTADLKTVMDMPHVTPAEKLAKTAAYKSALSRNLKTEAVPMPERWTNDSFAALLDANAAAATEATRANEYITITLGQTYPVDFAI